MRCHLLFFCLLATLGASAIATSQTVSDPNLTVTPVITSGDTLYQPSSFAIIGPNDFLALETILGRVRRIYNGNLRANPVLDLNVNGVSGERGLLGIALHPNFATNGFVYLYWTESSTSYDSFVLSEAVANRVTRFHWNGTVLESPVNILTLPVMPGPNHNAGYMIFGPDGKLYVQTGDLHRNGQLQNYPAGPAPDSTSVILRVNPDGSAPPDNPFFALGAPMAPFLAYGIRNSFGMMFDPVTGTLWQSENGPFTYDELNIVQPGFNSGWEQLTGPDARDPEGVGDLWMASPAAHYSDPEFSWLTPICATGIAFPSTSAFGASYFDAMLVGDCNNGRILRFRFNPARNGFVFTNPGLLDLVADDEAEMAELVWATGFNTVVDLKVAGDGTLYVLTWHGFYRIRHVSPADATVSMPALVTANDPNPFAGSTQIRFATSRPGPVLLSIYDASGREVRRLVQGWLASGAHVIEWDGRDALGNPVAAGVYYYATQSSDGAGTGRAVVVR